MSLFSELGEEILKKLSCSGDSKKRKLSPIYFSMDTILKNIRHIQINSCNELLATVIYLQKWLHHNKVSI